MTSRLLDLTSQFNADAKVQIDVSEWDYVVAHFVSPTGTVTFKGSNDGGAIAGVSEGDANSATNWVAINGLNLATNSSATSIAATSLFKFNVVGKFIQFESVANTVTKLLIQLSKIY